MKRILSFGGALLLVLAFAGTANAATTWYVNGKSGNDGNDCKSAQTACKSIGHAIALASSGDTIMVAASTYRENLFIGSGITLSIIGDAATTTRIDGGQNNRVLAIEDASANITLSNMTIRRGVASGGGGILNWGTLTISNSIIINNSAASSYSSVGGAIFNYLGTLTVNNTTFSSNGGSTHQMWGGAIDNEGVATINNSTFSGNYADGAALGGGGAIWNDGTLTINNSTFSGNKATGSGGGAIANESGTTTISNSTISNNSATGSGGGGIYNTATTILQNSIVADNKTGGNCAGTAMTSNGYNLSSDSSCNFGSAGDLNSTKPLLGGLTNNGGPTKTRALLLGSPAIDAGNPAGCTDGEGNLLTTDQRGYPRPDQDDTGGCDMGAYESD